MRLGGESDNSIWEAASSTARISWRILCLCAWHPPCTPRPACNSAACSHATAHLVTHRAPEGALGVSRKSGLSSLLAASVDPASQRPDYTAQPGSAMAPWAPPYSFLRQGSQFQLVTVPRSYSCPTARQPPSRPWPCLLCAYRYLYAYAFARICFVHGQYGRVLVACSGSPWLLNSSHATSSIARHDVRGKRATARQTVTYRIPTMCSITSKQPWPLLLGKFLCLTCHQGYTKVTCRRDQSGPDWSDGQWLSIPAGHQLIFPHHIDPRLLNVG